MTVEDTTPPVLTLPADITVEGNTTGGANVTVPAASATDIVDPAPVVVCLPPSGFFPLGETEVTCTAEDTSGNIGTASFTVTVEDTTPPILTLPADITAEATSPAGAPVGFTATATDIVDPAPVVDCVPASGTVFPLDDTTVNCTAIDAEGNVTGGSFTVTVEDTTPPILTLPANITAEATSPAGAPVGFTATATDIVDPAPVVDCVPASGTVFPLGTTTVNCTASDAEGNITGGSLTVTVEDTTPPVLSVPADIEVDATSRAGAVVNYPPATATDAVGVVSGPTCTPPSGSTFPIATTVVTCEASDAAGNVGSDTFTVEVKRLIVTIDISPDSAPNPINLKSNGVLTVAVLTDDDFDATRLDPPKPGSACWARRLRPRIQATRRTSTATAGTTWSCTSASKSSASTRQALRGRNSSFSCSAGRSTDSESSAGTASTS